MEGNGPLEFSTQRIPASRLDSKFTSEITSQQKHLGSPRYPFISGPIGAFERDLNNRRCPVPCCFWVFRQGYDTEDRVNTNGSYYGRRGRIRSPFRQQSKGVKEDSTYYIGVIIKLSPLWKELHIYNPSIGQDNLYWCYWCPDNLSWWY